jgi:hypothetical protein
MPEPLTLAVLGGVVATEGIKFLYGQASELLKVWRERRHAARASGASGNLIVPVKHSDALDGQPGEGVVDEAVLEREHKALVQLTGALSPYAQGQADIDPSDSDLADQAGRLRALLEEAYHQRFTFTGEDREPTGSAVTVRQALGEVEGEVIGAAADVRPGGVLRVDQDVKTVKSSGSVTGFKGNVGR